MKFTTDSRASVGLERSRCSAPTGLALRPAERRAAIPRQRFRQDQQAIERIGKAQGGRDPERQPRVLAAEQAADRRPDNETGAERRADLAEHRRAPFHRRDVGDVGERGRDAGRGDAGDHPADEQPAQRRRQRHQHVVEARGRNSTAAPPAAARTGPTGRPGSARRRTASAPRRCRTGRRCAPRSRCRCRRSFRPALAGSA